MRTILGPYHPDLENALVNDIKRFKAEDLLCPLLILVPSDVLRQQLKRVLAQEHGQSLLNVAILTFSQLSNKLFAEAEGAALPATREELFFEEVLRQMIRAGIPGTAPFAGIENRAGGCNALWQTLRDLRDALVDPETALEALQEGHFRDRTRPRTAQLLALLRSFNRFCHDKTIVDRSDIDRRAMEQATASNYLQQFRQIFYYGFYDLTQLQLDFFLAVARHHPTTLFFPLLKAKPEHPAWHFAASFYERYIQGQSGETITIGSDLRKHAGSQRIFDDDNERAYAPLPKAWCCEVIDTYGIPSEVATAAKEILRLIDDDGYRFRDIAIVARSLESYWPVIRSLCSRHQIPLASQSDEALTQFPLVKTVILMLKLPEKDFLRRHVIDLLSSPHWQWRTDNDPRPEPRPELWDLATRELAICKGAAEWARLRRLAERDLVLQQLSDDDEPRVIKIAAEQLQYLADTVHDLIDDFAQLPARASWREFSDIWRQLLGKSFGIGRSIETADESATELGEAITNILDQLADLDAIEPLTTAADYCRTFQHWLERGTVKRDERNRDGVAVLNATSARGLSFKALFLLGMNEGVFPRSIREDAFLRDSDREVLERDLGFKTSQKLAAYDEERLLFTLLISAAKERLYCSYLRTDDHGRALAPSWYLAELERAFAAQKDRFRKRSIPRSIVEQAEVEPYRRDDLLLPSELAVRLTLQAQDPSTLIKCSDAAFAVYEHGRKVIGALEKSGTRMSKYDGIVRNNGRYWDRIVQRGLAPTALETYARCPYQFFATQMLGLGPLEWPEDSLGVNSADFGKLGHEILQTFYDELRAADYFAAPPSPVNVPGTLKRVAAEAFTNFESKNPIGYPLAWDVVKDNLVQLLLQVVKLDLQEMKTSGFLPIALESAMTGQLPTDWPSPLKGMRIHGRIDRIDRTDTSMRIVDYKFKLGAGPKTEDRNLERAALRGQRLQPPVYCLLAQTQSHDRSDRAPPIEAAFYYIAGRWQDGPLVTVSYKSDSLMGKVGKATKQTLAYLAEGIRRGNFFLHVGEHCSHCDVATICRRNHPPSLWRADNDRLTEKHRRLREKDAKKL